MPPLRSLIALMILLGLCVATIDKEAVYDAQATVTFLAKQVEKYDGKPGAIRLIYLIGEALQRYHPRAAFASWEEITVPVMASLQAVYRAANLPLTPGWSSTMEGLDEERTAAEAIFAWTDRDDNQAGAYQYGNYHPGVKMFIILHTVAVACRETPIINRAIDLAANWLTSLDLEQLTLCEFIMIDLYRLVNEATWDSNTNAAAEFFRTLEINSLWDVPTGHNHGRLVQWKEKTVISPWEHWMGLFDISPSELWMGLQRLGPWLDPDGTEAGHMEAVFSPFKLFLMMSVSYIEKILPVRDTELGKNHASHMFLWVERMWDRVEKLLVHESKTHKKLQKYVDLVRNDLGPEFWLESSALRPPINEGSSGSLSHYRGG